MRLHPEDHHATVETGDLIELPSIAALASDLDALADRLEALLAEQSLAGEDFAYRVHELRSRSERLLGAN